MEAVKQTLSDGIAHMTIIGVIGVTLIIIIGLFFADKSIATDEAFKVTSDTSKYSCVISEVDKDLSLDCLRVK